MSASPKLIPYAGFDAGEGTGDGYVGSRAASAYALFQQGMDTFDIAKRYRIHEATALRWISQERSRRLGLPAPLRAQEAA